MKRMVALSILLKLLARLTWDEWKKVVGNENELKISEREIHSV